MIITIDGPSGTGKSTVARKVAETLGFTYFDTGAMYRSVTWALLQKKIPLSDLASVEAFLAQFTFDIRIQNGRPHYFVMEDDVTEVIRSQHITDAVSEVSAIPSVRKALWKIQKAYSERQSSVFEGRDLGTVVFPDAEVKIFLDASPEVRAKRRLAEMQQKRPDEAASFNEKSMQKELERRDAYDANRALAPLRCPKNARRIDTSEYTIDQVVEKIIDAQSKYVRGLLPTWLCAKPMRLLYRLVILCAWLPTRIFYRHKVYGLEHFVKRAAIIAPNHTSYLDPPLAAISWPREMHFLAREGLFKPFLFGSFIRALNSHPVSGDVGDVSVFKMLIQILKEGKQVVLFPEGERTDGKLGEVKPGIGMLLMRSQSAIIPTYIHGAHEAWPREKKLPKLFARTACVFGRPLLWESFSHLEKKQAQIEISKVLRKEILALKDWYEKGAEGIPP